MIDTASHKPGISYYILQLLQRKDVWAFVLCLMFFLLWPRFDLIISQFFYDPASRQFIGKQSAVAEFIYQLTNVTAVVYVSSLVILLLAGLMLKSGFVRQQRKAFIYLLCISIVGPGLLVNLTFKNNWDRPRPRQVIEFAGAKNFEPPLAPTFQCQGCSSFVSGHASVGFMFFGLALLSRKRRWIVAAALAGTIVGLTRISQGGHFLSDVIFSGWVVWFSSRLLYWLFYQLHTDSVCQSDREKAS